MKFEALKSVDGPVLASYTGPVPSDSQQYKVFKGPIIKKSKTAAKRFIIAEDEHVNYIAETCDNNDSQCEYMAGIYNERTKTLKFMKVPLCEFGVRVKRARIDKSEEERLETGKQWDRLALEFGSAKARKRIKEKSLYSIDEADLEIARTEYIPSLAAKIASDSRTQEQNSDKRSKSVGKKFDFRPPPHNKDATTPAEVYKLQDVAPDLDDVDVVPLFKAESSEARMDLIPIASPYMKSHLSSAIAANDVQKTKIILYLAYLIAFYRMGEEGQIG
ncbi:6751_t:CDS:2, partial [Paraglomus occultum]